MTITSFFDSVASSTSSLNSSSPFHQTASSSPSEPPPSQAELSSKTRSFFNSISTGFKASLAALVAFVAPCAYCRLDSSSSHDRTQAWVQQNLNDSCLYFNSSCSNSFNSLDMLLEPVRGENSSSKASMDRQTGGVHVHPSTISFQGTNWRDSAPPQMSSVQFFDDQMEPLGHPPSYSALAPSFEPVATVPSHSPPVPSLGSHGSDALPELDLVAAYRKESMAKVKELLEKRQEKKSDLVRCPTLAELREVDDEVYEWDVRPLRPRSAPVPRTPRAIPMIFTVIVEETEEDMLLESETDSDRSTPPPSPSSTASSPTSSTSSPPKTCAPSHFSFSIGTQKPTSNLSKKIAMARRTSSRPSPRTRTAVGDSSEEEESERRFAKAVEVSRM